MAIVASDMILRCVFDGSISIQDKEIERRPYHRNCGCALHNTKGVCANSCPQQRTISFPKKQSWTNSAFCIEASTVSSRSSLNVLSNKNREEEAVQLCQMRRKGLNCGTASKNEKVSN
ncbi:hypothetical protein HS088_TW09G00091 [Tripterygium wilfordii]|uniref:Uncharacterized protein n=1 Tax=Tripterygium wilfordii TaxID=458696 RepID=A0A7J7D6U8_TRIWF|nr:hypothetical protein HS088_TW09G00091 [Tripterygium wilfordii]